ncbi:MAG: glycosyltransferase family 2 protein [Clostridia bacterium]|nr:glycosyltransferase family 2 protein [Clostridia bacterium]
MNNPLVSIIVPVYKVEKYIKRCLDSIIGQSYRNIEIILIDDCSPDKCPEICDEYSAKDKRIKVIHKENGGVSSARNAGMEDAKGEFIMFVDSDDYVSGDFCEKAVSAALRSDADVVVFDYKRVDENGIEVKKINRPCPVRIPSDETVWTASEFCKRVVSADSEVCGYLWNKLIRKSIIGDLRFDKVFPVCEDLVFMQNIAAKTNKAVCIPDVLYFYVTNMQGATNSGELSGIYELNARNEVLFSVIQNFREHKDMATADFADSAFRIMRSLTGDEGSVKHACGILRKWMTRTLFCSQLRFKIKILYCIMALSPKLYFRKF